MPKLDGSSANRGKSASSLMKRLIALLLSIVFACLLIEVAVVVCFGKQPKFPRRVTEAPWQLRYNEPGAEYRHKSYDVDVHFRINKQGMRSDRDFTYEKPNDVKRIVSLGDSFTVGYEVSLEECFSSVLERELNKAGVRTEVLNAGVSGYSTAEECAYLERELIKYAPDLVVVSFYTNDLVDNVRANLFRLEAGELVDANHRYVPGGTIGAYLNRSALFNWLSGNSNAFALVKEKATLLVKGELVRRNEDNIERAVARQHDANQEADRESSEQERGQQRLAAAIYDRIYRFLLKRKIPLVIHSIPSEVYPERIQLIDTFPTAHVDLDQPGLVYVSAAEVLESYVGKRALYWQRSHFHWTPFSHERAGEALAQRIIENGLLSESEGLK